MNYQFGRKTKFVLVLAALASGLFVFGLFGESPRVSADSWFPPTCPHTEYFSGNTYDCGGPKGADVDQNHFSKSDKGTTKAEKQAFINDVEDSSAKNFYIDLIIGKPANASGGHDKPNAADITDFEERVDNPDIGIKVVYSGDISGVGCDNTEKVATESGSDFVSICDTDNFDSLVLYNDNKNSPDYLKTYTIIKIDCGNPLNSTPLPKYYWKLNATTTANKSTVAPGGSVEFINQLKNETASSTAASGYCYVPRYFYIYSSSSNPRPTTTDGTPYSNEVEGNNSTCPSGSLGVGDTLGPNSNTNETINNVSPPGRDNYICGTIGFSPYDSNNDYDGRSSPAACVQIVSSNWTITGTTKMYNTGADGGCSSGDHGSAISDGGAVTSGGSAKKICFYNAVTAKSSNPVRTDTFAYGVRYMTQNGSTWDPVAPPPGSRPTGGTPDPGGACAWPNNSGTTPALSSASSRYPAACKSADNNTTSLPPGSSTTGLAWRAVTVPANTPAGTQFCEYMAFSPYDNSGDKGGYSNAQCFTVKNPAPGAPTCNITAPDVSEPNNVFKVTVALSYANANDARNAYNSGIKAFTSIAGIPITTPGTSAVSGTSISITDQYGPGGVVPGQYTVNGGEVIGGVDTVLCSQPLNVGYLPFFSVLGGDVTAGAGFDASSCDNTSADIESWNDDTIGNYTGAGSQLGAMASGDIAHFITNSATDSSGLGTLYGASSSLPYVLSFANKGVTTDTTGDYGGSFGTVPCMHDYVSDVPDSSPAFSGDYGTSGTYDNSGDLTIPAEIIPPKTHLTIRVDGDVYISGNIKYGSDSGGIADIPSLAIYATGGIYINGFVTELHGTFVAEGTDPADPGVFATCATGPQAETTVFHLCDNSLTVYGSVLANQVDLERSYSSLNNPNGPAETFDYTPEEWLPTGGTACSIAQCPWAAVTSLPPVL